ncbi:MAG: hypothetical protein ACKOWP_02325 [Microbacteriaceae bacterium]
MDENLPESGQSSVGKSDANPSTGSGDTPKVAGSVGSAGGGILAGIGCLIAIAPIPGTFILCGLQGNPGGCGDMAMGVFITAPFGAVMMIIGLIVALMSGAREEPQRSDSAVEQDSAKNASGPTVTEVLARSNAPEASSSAPLKRPQRRYAHEQLAISRLANLVLLGDGLVILSTILNFVVLIYWTSQRPAHLYDESLVNWDQFFFVMTTIPLFFVLLSAPSAWKLRSRKSRVDAQSVLVPLNRTLIWIGLVSILAALWVVPDALLHNGAPLGIFNVIAAVTPVTCGVLGLCVAAIFFPRLLPED